MQAITTQARQGDVYLIRDEPFWPCSTVRPENGRHVLAHGEHTGHHHSFAGSDQIELLREAAGAPGSGGVYLEVKPGAPALLEHQEHGSIAVAPGTYRVLRQRQYTLGMAQRVLD